MAYDNITEYFGCMVFNESVMKERLSPEAYDMMGRVLKTGKRLDMATADAVADAMKEWAIENGATHSTHWFQPMTNVTAEKHDAFISQARDGAQNSLDAARR